MDRDEIKRILKGLKSLPTLPPIVSKLNEMVEDEDATAISVGKVIERDQVLTSKLLRMVNSSFFGFPQRISTVSNAIVLLGFNVIKTLVVSSSIFDVMQSSDIGLWEHSLGCAACATILATRRGIKNPEEVSTAALIHDIGKVVIRAEMPEEYQKIQDLVLTKDISMREAEEQVLGVQHSVIGGLLAKEWNLPDRLSIPIEFHHNPEEAPGFKDITAIIHVSDIIIRGWGFGFGGDKWVPPLDHGAWQRVKFGKSEGKEILEALDEKLASLQNFTMDLT